MISPALSAQIHEPYFLSGISDSSTGDDRIHGRCLEVVITPPIIDIDNSPAGGQNAVSNENWCRLFGALLYELYSGISPLHPLLPDELIRRLSTTGENSSGISPCDSNGADGEEPRRKKSTVRYDKKKGKPYSRLPRQRYAPLQELGFPSSVSRLVLDLMGDQDAYTTLDAVSADIHLLLCDPARFLFDRHDASTQIGHIQPFLRDHKLYGRENEVSLITDAFCRVSSGKNEAFFIGECL